MTPHLGTFPGIRSNITAEMETPFSVLSSRAELASLVKRGAPTSSDEIGKWPWAGFYVKLARMGWKGTREERKEKFAAIFPQPKVLPDQRPKPSFTCAD